MIVHDCHKEPDQCNHSCREFYALQCEITNLRVKVSVQARTIKDMGVKSDSKTLKEKEA